MENKNYRTRYKDASIRLVDKQDQLIEAWRISRPHFDESKFKREDIERLDLPLTSFIHYVFDITSSMLFRDLLFTMRPIAPWSKSNRSVPITPENYCIMSEYKDKDPDWHQAQMEKVYAMVEAGQPQDYAKLKLPMSGETTYALSIDDRTLMNFLNTLRIHNRKLFDVYGKLFLDAIGKDESYLDNRVMYDIYPKLAMSKRELRDAVLEVRPQHMGEFVYVSRRVQANLGAQFIRQHYSTVKSNLWNLLDDPKLSDTVDHMTCESYVSVAMYAPIQNLQKVIQNRSCYFAAFDKHDKNSWDYIIGDIVDSMSNEEFLDSLTCKGKCKNCTLVTDMLPKADAGKTSMANGHKVSGEVNPICPIFCERPDRVDFRGSMYHSDSKIFKKWKACKISGLLPDNPDNKVRKQFEENVKKYGHLGLKPNANEEPIYRTMDKQDYIDLMNKLGIDIGDSLRWWD